MIGEQATIMLCGLYAAAAEPRFSSEPTLYQYIDSLSWVRGRHSVRVGFETRQKSNTGSRVSRTVPCNRVLATASTLGEPLAQGFAGQTRPAISFN